MRLINSSYLRLSYFFCFRPVKMHIYSIHRQRMVYFFLHHSNITDVSLLGAKVPILCIKSIDRWINQIDWIQLGEDDSLKHDFQAQMIHQIRVFSLKRSVAFLTSIWFLEALQWTLFIVLFEHTRLDKKNARTSFLFTHLTKKQQCNMNLYFWSFTFKQNMLMVIFMVQKKTVFYSFFFFYLNNFHLNTFCLILHFQ